jgi:hypothetical protein
MIPLQCPTGKRKGAVEVPPVLRFNYDQTAAARYLKFDIDYLSGPVNINN